MNLSVIDAKIEKLQRIRQLLSDDSTRELLSDPEAMALLQQAISTGRTNGVLVKDNELDPTLPPEGSLIRTVLDTGRNCPNKFNTRYIVEKMKINGFRFLAQHPTISVNAALKKLTEQGYFQVVQQGSGRIPTIYENVPRSRQVKK